MIANKSPEMARVDELLPVSGNESAFFTVAAGVGTEVVGAMFEAVDATVVVVASDVVVETMVVVVDVATAPDVITLLPAPSPRPAIATYFSSPVGPPQVTARQVPS